jgi:predicted phage terminase large subunit-like protein
MNPLTFQMTASERRALYRNDLTAFISATFQVLNPDTPFQPNWHIELIASKLEACLRGETHRLIITLPPRNLKSICASVAFPAFILGKKPSAEIMCVSYGQELANKHALDTRRVMMSTTYRSLFPGTRLASDRMAVDDFSTTERGFRMATSVGGVLTGRGADFIIIDDPIKPEEAISDSVREQVNSWYHRTLQSRLNQKGSGCILLIMQRLHEDDLAGHLEATGNWKVLSLPAIAEVEEHHTIHRLGQTTNHTRHPGEALHPERESLQVLAEYRAGMGEYDWSAQYQQAPRPYGGGMVKDAWWGTYTNPPQKFEQVVQSWDTANKASELSDYSVCTTWGRLNKKFYLLHVFRERLDFPDLKRAVWQMYGQFHPTQVLIEDQASGTALIQELRREGMYHLVGIKPAGDKEMRMHARTAMIENGFVLLPEEAPWRANYLSELGAFPKGRFDDQVDSTSQALAYLTEHRPMFFSDELLRQIEEMPPSMGSPAYARQMVYGAWAPGWPFVF